MYHLRRGIALLAGFLMLSLAGCASGTTHSTTAPAVSGVATPSAAPSPSPTLSSEMTPTASATPAASKTVTPKETEKPGEWVPANGYGSKAPQYKPSSYKQKADDESIAAAEVLYAEVGNWQYTLDTAHAATFVSGKGKYYDFQLCRKDNKGKTQRLNLYCCSFFVAGDHIYFQNNQSSAGSSIAFNAWMADLDGGNQHYLGKSLNVLAPENSEFIYLSGFSNTVYRMDLKTYRFDRMLLVIPDWDTIKKSVKAKLFGVHFDEAQDGWLLFTLDVNDNAGNEYIGSYRVSADGGAVEKTDDGAYITN